MTVSIDLTPEIEQRLSEQATLSEIAAFCRRNGIRSLALFGSFLHGSASACSI